MSYQEQKRVVHDSPVYKSKQNPGVYIIQLSGPCDLEPGDPFTVTSEVPEEMENGEYRVIRRVKQKDQMFVVRKETQDG